MADQFKTFDKAPIVGVVNLKHWSFAVREIIVAVVAAVLLLLLIIFIALYASEKGDNDNDSAASAASVMKKHFCTTKECTQTAARALRLMNASVDPCDDFYQYACGGYKIDHPYANRQSARTTMNDISDLNDDRLLAVIQKPPARTTEWAYQKKLSDFYQSCKDDFGREQKLGRPFLEQVLPLLGGWDFLGTWNEATWDFNTALRKVQSDLWVDAFYSTTVTIDAANPKQNVIQVTPRGVGKYMNYEWYNLPDTHKFRVGYKAFIQRVASLLMRDSNNPANLTQAEQDSRLEQFVNDTFLVETQLANLIKTTPPSTDPFADENKVTVNDLNSETSGAIDFITQLSYLYKDARVNGNTKLVLGQRSYYTALSAMIQGLPDDNRKRILHNYLIWRCAEQYVQDLSWEYIHANRQVFVDIYGVRNFQGIERYCMLQIHYYMKDALGALFVQEHFAEKSRQKVTDITINLKKALKTQLDSTPWFDAATRRYAKEKLDVVTFKLGYPDWMNDENQVNQIYDGFTSNSTDFLATLLSANQFLRSRESKALVKGEDRQEWIFGPYETSVAVYWYWNEILAPAGVLQSPIYDRDAPHFTTFGSLGAILGRYLHHIVDDWGKHYDKVGENMSPKTWWSPYSVNAYKPVHQCVTDAYANVRQTYSNSAGSQVKVPIDATSYTQVAIASTSGVKLALKGYKDWVKDIGVKEKMLPSVGLSPDQMILLSYAQSYCVNRGEDVRAFLVLRRLVTEDTKVNMAMKQIPEFSDAFKCKAGTAMNPDKKCDYY